MKKIYVAGKLNDDACHYVQHMHNMIVAARAIRRLGCAVYVPCLDVLEGLMAGDMEYDDFFSNSQEFLKVCDAVYLCEGWETSAGTKREIKLARQHGLPIFTNQSELFKYIHGGKYHDLSDLLG